MKKSLTLAFVVLVAVPMAFPAIITNTNQSVQYIRMLSRNASIDIDAVYYNPAGLAKMSDGFHVAIHNQTIKQTKTVENNFVALNHNTYEGKVSVPIFPDIYVVYKKGPLALSFGFGPNAGGGSADYSIGLPSFEAPFAVVPYLLTGMGLLTTQYDIDIAFKGSSVYYGFQANATYALSDMIAVAAGIRYISAVNTYEGSLTNFRINPLYAGNPTAALIPGPAFFNAVGLPALAAQVSDRHVDAKQTGSAVTPILSLNVSPLAGLNLAVRYEFKTNLTLTNETTTDDTGLFPDGEKERADIPAILGLGVSYAFTPEIRAALSFNTYFEKSATWGPLVGDTVVDNRADLVNSNTYEIAAGVEFDVTEWLTLSAGYLITKYDVSADYQTDMDNILSANTIGFGGKLNLVPKLDIEFGVLIASYDSFTKDWIYLGTWQETYKRTTASFSIGAAYHF